MRILAIDPGPDNFHWVILDADFSQFDTSWISFGTSDSSVETVAAQGEGAFLTADRVVVEQIQGYGIPLGRHIEKTIRTTGRIEQAFGGVDFMKRKSVIAQLGLPGKSGDSAVNTWIWSEFGDGTRKSCVGTKKDPGPFYGFKKDYWQAFALGWAYYLRLKEESDGRSD